MCAQKIQRLIQASILGFIMGLAGIGIGGDQLMLQIAFLLQFAMMMILVIAGFTGWCPGLEMLKKIFPLCEETQKDKNS